jgi:hypothetical protein
MFSHGKRFKDTNYFITENGDVYRKWSDRYKKLKQQKTYGYLRIKIYPQIKWFLTHRLVAELYVPNPDNKPIVNHIDGNKLNNHYSNLEWVTDRENKDHAMENGLYPNGEKNGRNILSEQEIIDIRNTYKKRDKNITIKSLSLKYNVSKGCIFNIIHYRTWKHIP